MSTLIETLSPDVASALTEREGRGRLTGVLPAQALQRAAEAGWIRSPKYRLPIENVQPASLDLRLGDTAFRLRSSFVPDLTTSVDEKLLDIGYEPFDLRDGAVLERDRPYLIPLAEELRLPPGVRARTNPKSSTGRVDVFTRVITDRNFRFDEIVEGYHGKLYLEVVPRSFTVRVATGLALNQLRLLVGDGRLTDTELRAEHQHTSLLFNEGVPAVHPHVSDGLFISLDIHGGQDEVVGFRAKAHAPLLDMTRVGLLDWRDYWDPVFPERGGRVVLTPEAFYLLLSYERVRVPPHLAAEMMAYDPTAGELRTHYAGFFDPGFGHDSDGLRLGTKAALEVRARDVPFMIEHRQPICKLSFESMTEPPDRLYGEDLDSTYQDQTSTLSKHFADQTAGQGQLRLRKFNDSRPAGLGFSEHL